MIIVTGGAGFIGSAIVWKLNQNGISDILIVDNLNTSEKWKNLTNLQFEDYIHKDKFLSLIDTGKMPSEVTGIFHMGACSATTEKDADYLMENNFHYTQALAKWCLKTKSRFIYASSAATYGDGNLGFSDEDALLTKLRPMNRYGYSKHIFDLWAQRNQLLSKIVGLKFFNVFGPNEYHKNDMASVVYKSFLQIQQTGEVHLFKSHKDNYKDGEQKRDFIYVKDCVEVMWWLFNNENVNGIFNLGTGTARTWNDLVNSTFAAMNLPSKINYIPMPETIQNSYQYFTESPMNKLSSAGCPIRFKTLEESIQDYVVNYLNHNILHL